MAQKKKKAPDFTQKQRADYLKNPSKCPFCGSDNIEAGSLEADGDAWCYVDCRKCGACWEDIYKLADIQLVNSPTEKAAK